LCSLLSLQQQRGKKRFSLSGREILAYGFRLFPRRAALAEPVSSAAALSPPCDAWQKGHRCQPLLEQHPSEGTQPEERLESQTCGTSARLEMKLSYRFGIQNRIYLQIEEPGTRFNTL